MVVWEALWTVGGMGFFRAFAGWFKNSVEDGAIQSVEWKKLVETFAIFLTMGILAMIGADYTSVETVALIGIGAAFLINELWNALKKKAAIAASIKKVSKKK